MTATDPSHRASSAPRLSLSLGIESQTPNKPPAAFEQSKRAPSTALIWRLIEVVARLLYYSLLEPGDDFLTRVRKLVCVIYLTMSPYPFLVAAYYLVVREAQGDKGAGALLWIIGGSLGTLTCVVPWLFVRVFRRVPRALLEFAIGMLNVAFTLSAVGTTQTPLQLGAMANGVFAATAFTPLFPLHLFQAIVVLFIQIYNESNQNTGSFVFMVPTPRVGPPGEHLGMLCGGIVALAVLLVGLRFMTWLLVKQGQAAADTVQLTQVAAQKLTKYDTDGVREVLSEFRARGHISAELIDSFTLLVQHLERYKPHLPNYVLQDDPEADESEGKIDSKPECSNSDFGENQAQTLRLSSGRLPRTESHSRRAASLDEGIKSSSSGDSAPRTDVPLEDALRTVAGRLRRQRVSFASLHFQVPGSGQSLATAAAELNGLVDALHDWAGATHGAIHSLMGDVVSVSWNAISRTAQPEVNACRFACRLARYCRRGMRAGGAIFTGDAVVGMAGTKQMLPTMERPVFEAALEYGAALGRRHNVMVACSRTMATASLTIDGYPVEAVTSMDDAGKRSTWVLSVVEGEKAQEDDEWMYTLEKQCDHSPAAVLDQAVKAALEKDYGKAAQFLATLPQSYSASRGLIVTLRERVERCLADRSAPFAAVLGREMSCDPFRATLDVTHSLSMEGVPPDCHM